MEGNWGEGKPSPVRVLLVICSRKRFDHEKLGVRGRLEFPNLNHKLLTVSEKRGKLKGSPVGPVGT